MAETEEWGQEKVRVEEEELTEQVVQAVEDQLDGNPIQKRGRGRPKGRGSTVTERLVENATIPIGRRRSAAHPSDWRPKDDNLTAGVTPRQKDLTSTTTRPSFYLIGKPPTSLAFSKLPPKSGFPIK